jgi:hypothetical protein
MAGRINIISYLHGLWKRFKRRQFLGDLRYVESMQEIPDRLEEFVYIVGLQKPKWVIIPCPCRCGERLEINLMRSRHPRWHLQLKNGVISLWPSLWMTDKKCGSHFWIERNRVIWVPEHYRPRKKGEEHLHK